MWLLGKLGIGVHEKVQSRWLFQVQDNKNITSNQFWNINNQLSIFWEVSKQNLNHLSKVKDNGDVFLWEISIPRRYRLWSDPSSEVYFIWQLCCRGGHSYEVNRPQPPPLEQYYNWCFSWLESNIFWLICRSSGLPLRHNYKFSQQFKNLKNDAHNSLNG